MTSYKAGDVVWIALPHFENERTRVRPALVISDKMVGPEGSLLWAMMITNALRPDWPGDIVISDHQAIGLPHTSKIRTAKIATLEADGAEKIGRISDALLMEVREALKANLGIGSDWA
jgi:mRNA interferase MazF